MKLLKQAIDVNSMERNKTSWLTNPDSDLVFHYTSQTKALENILHSGQILFGNLCHTNDLYESYVWGFAVRMAGGTDREFSDQWNSVRSITELLHRKSRLFCTTRDSCGNPLNSDNLCVDRGYTVPSLWAHYAEKHKGVCFAFDEAKLRRTVSDTAKTIDAYVFADYISYDLTSSDQQRAFEIDLAAIDENKMSESILKHIETHQKTILFTKDSTWIPEKEFRFVVICNDDVQFKINIFDSIVGIILGPQFPDCYEPLILEAKTKFNIHVARTYYEIGKFHVFSND